VGREIVVARSVAGRPLRLKPLAPASGQHGSVGNDTRLGRSVRSTVTVTRPGQDAWRRLLDYYRDVLALEAANDTLLPLRQPGRQRFALWRGPEEILVGDRARVHVPSGTPAEALIRQAQNDGRRLAYGYPAVLLFDRQDDRKGELAPLFTRIVEASHDDDGWHLQPVGAVLLHPGLIKRRLKSDADAALAEFEPGWSAGSHSQLAREARDRLKELGLSPGALRPTELESELNDQHPRSGGRNAALLYEAPESTDMTRGLVDELEKLRDKTNGFAETALAALAPDSDRTVQHGEEASRSPPSVAGGTDPVVVAPFDLNEAQEAVLRSAMTQRLTVATGPPGTGKSQLVANLVATAVANERSVLVTSTNNRAVDEVWQRCERIAPGLVIRTGSRTGERDYEQVEINSLRGLRSAGPPDAKPDWDRLRLRTQDRDATLDRFAHKVRTETELLDLSLRRTAVAGSLGFDLADLPAPLAQDSRVDSVRRRAQRALRDPLFGGWRRRRLATLLSLPDAARETCSKTAEFLKIETRWRQLRAEADGLPSDVRLTDELRINRTKVRDSSRALVSAIVATNVRRAQDAIALRLQALQSTGSKWGALNKIRPHLSAWAVTTHSARRLPLDKAWFDLVIVDEATQCSIPAVLPMLYRAERVLIIGDPMQLTHITTCTAAQNGASRRAAGLEAAFLERFQLDYIRHSAFHAAAAAFGEPLMLNEHFRCHPEIIALPNRLFYGDRLTVLTDPKRLARAGHLARLRWVDAPGSPTRTEGSSWHNREEVDEVCNEVTRLRETLPAEATIGVVTPFAAQKDAIKARVGRIAQVGTIHTFQGSECDAMVLSLVGGHGMYDSTVSWLERSANLWNVAITRARAHLVLVGHRDFWRRRAGVVGDLARDTTGDRDSLRPPDDGLDTTGDALHRCLDQRFPDAFDRHATLDGYSCDFRINLSGNGGGPAGSVAIILDRGADRMDVARHLRLQFERCELLRRAGMSAVARVPAWQVHAEPDRVLSALTAGVDRSSESRDSLEQADP
jgi:Mrp family chromosome partitioning ATPase